MFRKKYFHRFVLALVIAATTVNIAKTVPLEGRSTKKSALDLVILHNNDMHARFEQTDKFSAKCHPDEIIDNKCYGGFARVSHILKEHRKAAENGGPPVLYLNAGDTYTGTPWFTIYKDRIVSEFMNKLKPDAISLGNHELDLGVSGLVPFLNDVDFPVLVANINNTADHPLWKTRALKKSVVFDIKGFKVGVIGYLTPETKLVATPNDLEFVPEVFAINEEAEALRKKDVKIIIALGHSGYEVDKDIAKNCPLVDIVIGGHSNTFLFSGDQPDIEQMDGPYPTVIKQSSGKEVPVVQAYAFTKYLGKMELSFDADGNLIKWGGAPILLNGSVPRDEEVLKLLEKYRPAVYELTESRIGYSKVLLDGNTCRTSECNLGNLISDALVYARVNQYEGEHWTDAAICFIQGGGIRGSAPFGHLTKFDLKTILPFNNSMLLVNMTGTGILQVLEHSVEHYTGDRGEFLQMSGIRVVYNMTKDPGHRVQSVETLCTDCEVPSYMALEPLKNYRVILSLFLYKGGDGYSMIKNFPAESMDDFEFDAVQKYIEDAGTVYPVVEGRITLIDIQSNEQGTASRFTVSISMLFVTVMTLFNYFQ
ncbi:protein 5NUC-like [Sitodiplosis mosellana]|uniref:protein 5NUC-like n=1 Tax=Sitodiplosis mosellana TaxID=263140 RepID=UPI0024448567|nr:protein 5NUC-like [Sitodiplosis mosellana]XP_055316675.1 protein 5NUC-like [Sitodiplosis mosellana]XP_055316676.1 protein 5NUC-like [Sitodiplosis mosellana]XP_055316677.1 protein 5NUC-like [Sitodiplosis mosellana]